jgi:hypothetical protein
MTILYFLAAGSFVYCAIEAQKAFGDKVYFISAGVALLVGYLLSKFGG